MTSYKTLISLHELERLVHEKTHVVDAGNVTAPDPMDRTPGIPKCRH